MSFRDLIFFDTTNTYFEIDELGPSQLKAYGKSKDKRDDLPLITIGLAVTREDIPVKWLALLLIRIAETETQMSWPKIQRTMQRLNLVEFLTKDGRILQHT